MVAEVIRSNTVHNSGVVFHGAALAAEVALLSV